MASALCMWLIWYQQGMDGYWQVVTSLDVEEDAGVADALDRDRLEVRGHVVAVEVAGHAPALQPERMISL